MDNLLIYLVGGLKLKNMKVNWDDELPNIWENKTCSKPPTSYIVYKKKTCVHLDPNSAKKMYSSKKRVCTQIAKPDLEHPETKLPTSLTM